MPNACCDLHIHSYYSDGRASPAEILHYAVEIGLKTIAITDHDNLNAYHESVHVASNLGLELLPGVEITTRWQDCRAKEGAPQDVDLLGYFFEPEQPGLQQLLQAAQQDLQDRIDLCCQLLTQAGYPITLFDVQDENPRYPGTMQLITALWHKGYASSWGEAFPIFSAHWSQVREPAIDLREAIAVIHAAGGIAVLAHPIAVDCDGEWLQDEQIRRLVEMGLDGLEVLHPRMTAEARQHFTQLAQRYQLEISGGSDEHGWANGFPRMGSELVTYDLVHRLRQRAQKWIEFNQKREL